MDLQVDFLQFQQFSFEILQFLAPPIVVVWLKIAYLTIGCLFLWLLAVLDSVKSRADGDAVRKRASTKLLSQLNLVRTHTRTYCVRAKTTDVAMVLRRNFLPIFHCRCSAILFCYLTAMTNMAEKQMMLNGERKRK